MEPIVNCDSDKSAFILKARDFKFAANISGKSAPFIDCFDSYRETRFTLKFFDLVKVSFLVLGSQYSIFLLFFFHDGVRLLFYEFESTFGA